MRVWWGFVVFASGLVAAAGGCLEAGSVDCGGGFVCARGLRCVTVPIPEQDAEHLCVTPEQVSACDGIENGMPCEEASGVATASCQGGACLPIVCGNRLEEPGEACDDGDTETGDGTCSSDCLSDETCGNGEIDPLVLVDGRREPNEECDDGNLVSGDGCSSTCATETLQWAQLSRREIPLGGAAIAYDPVRRRVVMFGGQAPDDLDTGAVHSDTTYLWDGVSWSAAPVLLAPSPRRDAGMVFDAARRVTVLYGGYAGDPDDSPFTDTWTWDGHQWTQHIPAMKPPRRAQFAMTYDAANKRVVMFGGCTKADGCLNDTWTWDGSTWTELVTPTRPGARREHAMAYDPVRGVVVMAGGNDDGRVGAAELADTWELRGSTWVQTVTTQPAQLDSYAAIAYDVAGSRMIAYGGRAYAGAVSAGTLEYTGTAWNPIASSSQPGLRWEHALVFDPHTRTVLLFGGTDESGTRLGSTHVWTQGSWSQPPAAIEYPSATSSTAAYDPEHGRFWVFGGEDDTGTPLNTLASYDGSSWRAHTSGTTPPGPRFDVGLVYDSARRELVLFGGQQRNTADEIEPVPAETWTYDGTSWTVQTPAMSPSARFGHTMVYDPVRKVVVLFGGLSATQTPLDDTWEWNGAEWTPITSATHPTARLFAQATYDDVRGALVVSQGFTIAGFLPVGLSDTWTYDGTWTQVATATNVGERFSPAAYDKTARTSFLFSGQTFGGSQRADTWMLQGTSWIEQFIVAVPPARGRHAMTSSPAGAGVVLLGGTNGDGFSDALDDVWTLRYLNEQPREQCDHVVDADGDGLSGCEDPDCWSRCTPLCPPGAFCDAAAPRCGDDHCNTALENCRNCAADCDCTAACGDSFCDAPETQASCPGDCTP